MKFGCCVRKSQTACPWLITYSWLGTGTPSCCNTPMKALSTMASGGAAALAGAGAVGASGCGFTLDGGIVCRLRRRVWVVNRKHHHDHKHGGDDYQR